MSSALAIAGVTATLRHRLNEGLVDADVSGTLGGSVTVSVLPPDRIVAATGTEASQLNLFLYQVAPNPGWRNEGLPSRDPSGRQRLDNPPLALDLHYLVTAYTSGDLHAEILLGHAMQLMHEFPVVTRAMIRSALDPPPQAGATLPPALRALADCGLADQLELIKITPQPLNTDELSKLWTATQSSIRPSAAYHVSVVLIEPEQPTRPSLPVLSRGPVDPVSRRDRGVVVEPGLVPPLPTLESVTPADGHPVALPGRTIALGGHHLDGGQRRLRLVNDRFDIDEVLHADAGNAAGRIEFSIPAARAADFPVGLYQVSALVTRPDGAGTKVLETNRMALVLAPWVAGLPATVDRDGAGNAGFALDFTPQLRPGQRASLLLGQRELAPEAFDPPTTSLDFVVPDAEPGRYLARLRIDGIDSPIIDRTARPPVFLDQRIEIR